MPYCLLSVKIFCLSFSNVCEARIQARDTFLKQISQARLILKFR